MTDSKKASGLLKTRNADLTPEILEKLAVMLGTASRPFPMYDSYRNAEGEYEQVFSVIKSDSNPLTIYSERPYNEVTALALCDMPVPTMLRQFKDGIERRALAETDNNRTHMIIGDPGFGKTFMAGLLGRLRSKEKVQVFDCGGKNLNELLFEMVLDFGTSNVLPDTIDARLKSGSLHPLSYGKLKQLASLTHGISAEKKSAVTLDAEGNIASIDWNFFKGIANAEQVDKARAILDDVAKNEGIDNAGGNALGMNSQYGPVIRAFIEGRELVLDEYNKSKEGGDNALQTFLQFANGEMPEVTVDNPLKNKDASAGPVSFTFRREDTKAGFFLTLTGNRAMDGITTRVLNKSVYSRLDPDTLAFPTVEDWQHRICQVFTGMPVSTLYKAYEESADADPAGFGKFLLNIRREKAKIEGTTVPALEEALLENWQGLNRASEKLAEIFEEWSRLVDPDRTDPLLQSEIDEEYATKDGVDFRTIIQLVKKSRRVLAHMEPPGTAGTIDFDNFLKKPVVEASEPEDPALFLGSRIVENLMSLINRKTAGRPQLQEQLKALAEAKGLFEISLQEAQKNPDQRSVEEDLNLTAFSSNNPARQAELARKVLCDFLRERDPEITETNDDAIMTVNSVRSVLKQVEATENSDESRTLFYVNRDLDTLVDKPLEEAYIEDVALAVAAGVENYKLPFGVAELVSQEDFLATLAMPVVGKKNLEALWDNNIEAVDEGENGDDESGARNKESLHIAAGNSDTGVATTSLRVRFQDAAGEEKAISLHFVTSRSKTLVVGEAVPSKLQRAFKEAGIIHVDRNGPNAQAKIDTALGEITRGLEEETKQQLVNAFKFRNGVFFENYLLRNKGAVTQEQFSAAQQALSDTKDATITEAYGLEIGSFLREQGVFTAAQEERLKSKGTDVARFTAVTSQQLADAKAALREGGDLGAYLVENKLITQEQLTAAKKHLLGLPKINPTKVPSLEDVLLLTPAATAEQVAKGNTALEERRKSLLTSAEGLQLESFLIQQGAITAEKCEEYHQEWKNRSLSDLLLDSRIDMFFPKYAVRKSAAPQP